MEKLLFLAHRIPFPPNKGDKIRSYNLLKHLATRFEIFLGTFIDDPDDRAGIEPLREFCQEIGTFDLHPQWRKIVSLSGFINGKPLTLPYYSMREMQTWVDAIVKSRRIGNVLVFSSSMAQYVDSPNFSTMMRVVDFVDVDSEKWRAYATRKNWPASGVYKREANLLAKYEISVAHRFDCSLFVSSAEAALFQRLSGLGGEKVRALRNGVDTDFFAQRSELENPYNRNRPVLVFTGAMDYWANVDAVCWFAQEVFVQIRKTVPNGEFWIVGSKPSDSVQRLEQIDGVRVTGAVDDIRPYLQYARAAVAPLRIARGIQNKVLEAMAMNKPVIATPDAIEGIEIGAEYESLITEKVVEMVDIGCTALTGDQYNSMGLLGRAYVESRHGWSAELDKLNTLFMKGF